MIGGFLELGDISIHFNEIGNGNSMITVIQKLHKEIKCETLTVNSVNLGKALSIAIHYEGMPDFETDYEDALSIMGDIKWIP